jgi:nucleotide-binding universal stress UspA family protein
VTNDRVHGEQLAGARLLVAYIGEGDQLDHVGRAAVRLAGEHGARVILYDRDAASAFSDPLPNQWASKGEGSQFSDPLSDQELVKLGREPLARQVTAARDQGVDAWAWLPQKHGTDELVEYARRHGADAILLPADLDEPGLAERLKGETVEAAVDAVEEAPTGIAVLLVSPDGTTSLAAGRL